MYTIILNDGTKIENLELNGNNYIAEGVIDDSMFEGNLDTVTITDGETTETLTNMRLLSNIVRDGRSWIVLGEKSEQQLKEEARDKQMKELEAAMTALFSGKEEESAEPSQLDIIEAQVTYTAMMTDTLLEV